MGKLYDKMKKEMDFRNYSSKTIKTYLSWMRNYTKHYGKSPDLLGDDEIYEYLYYLEKEKKFSQASISQAYSSLKFFYGVILERDWNDRKIPRSRRQKNCQ